MLSCSSDDSSPANGSNQSTCKSLGFSGSSTSHADVPKKNFRSKGKKQKTSRNDTLLEPGRAKNKSWRKSDSTALLAITKEKDTSALVSRKSGPLLHPFDPQTSATSTAGSQRTTSKPLKSKKSSKPKQFDCSICGKTCSTKFSRDRHEKTHQQLDSRLDFVCSICGNGYTESGNLTRHIRKTHAIKGTKSAKEGGQRSRASPKSAQSEEEPTVGDMGDALSTVSSSPSQPSPD